VHHCSRWSQFGPVRPHGNWHKGIDIYAPTGTPVAAAVSGQLAYAHDPGGWGLYARIQLDPRQAGPDGTCRTAAPVELIYAHLDDDDPNLRTGVDQPVLAGSIIGRVGCSGNASSMCSPSPESHLHFSVRHGSGDRAKVDPLPVVGWLLFEPHASMFSPPLARCPWP
jgi:murein DD-endopeptidase MepM/ murein hydrolase activator NlpD